MPRIRYQRKRKTAGSAPGTLIHTGERKIEQTRLWLVDYDQNQIEEIQEATLEAALSALDTPRLTWLNIDGLHDTDLIDRIGRHLRIHPLTLEDVVHTLQRPKIENYEQYFYIVFKMLHFLPQDGQQQRNQIPSQQIHSEQISIILTRRVLVSFQEAPGDVFAPVRERLQKEHGTIRMAGSDYLAYALIDAVVDHYFIILDHIGSQIDELEEQIIAEPNPALLQRLHDLKREVLTLRKHIWPLRELLAAWIREESELIRPETRIFLRDVYDHSIQVIDTIEAYRDLLSSLLDLHMSMVGNRTNEVMKVLTIIATIFIPLTFIAGVYGMNFEFMPELKWRYGYPLIWAVMAAVAVVMLIYFRRKRWL